MKTIYALLCAVAGASLGTNTAALTLAMLLATVAADHAHPPTPPPPLTTPSQYFYTEDGARNFTRQGCTLSEWVGIDPAGMAGYPWLTRVVCPRGTTYTASGTAVHGAVRIYLATGSLSVNGDAVTLMGSSFWANAGASVDVAISGGVAFVVGSRFELDARVPAAHFSTSYRAPVVRKYDVADAVANTSNASNVHDIHVNNGTTNARDMLWPATASHVDPPSIVAINCAPTESYVLSHSHPQGKRID